MNLESLKSKLWPAIIDIRGVITKELQKIGLEIVPTDLEHPKDLKNGDFSVFVKDKSVELERFELTKVKHDYISDVSLVGRFVNIKLSPKYFADMLKEILSMGIKYGKNKNLSGKQIIIEYTDPNPFKEFHIGHLMSNAVGESLSRITEWCGADIIRANYQGDVGPHVAKAIWGMQKLISENASAQPADTESLGEKSAFLGKAYVLGANQYEENPEAKKQIDTINKAVYEKSQEEINSLYEWGRKVSLEHFETIYKKLGTKFDEYFFESQSAPIGLFIIEELLAKGILEKSDGAVIFPGEKYGLHTRVFVNSIGLPTYETKELGLSKLKFEKRDFDQSIIITATEQEDYFNVLLKVLEFADPAIANKTRHVTHGMMRFAEGKMSSRKGNVITGESLIADVENLVQEKIKERGFGEGERNEIAEIVAVGAIKYSILKQSPGKDIIFDFNKSLSFEGDSGPYLQYTYARASSILRNATEARKLSNVSVVEQLSPEQAVQRLTEVERLLARFPDVVERAREDQAPQLIVTYLTHLASAFNHFYAENIIVSDDAQAPYRVAITEAVRNVLGAGLYLLGIRAPERM